jgi:hypothetical protein
LLLIDVEKERERVPSRVQKGFICPTIFENGKLVYRKEYFAPRKTIEFEIEFLSIDRWENLNIQGHL